MKSTTRARDESAGERDVVEMASVYVPEPGDAFFSRPVPDCGPPRGAAVLDLRRLGERYVPLERQRDAERLTALRQGSEAWLRERWAHATSSRLLEFLGYFPRERSDAGVLARIYGARDKLLDEMESAFEARAMQFESARERAVGEERMAHGSAHEDDGLATLLSARPTLRLRECVLQHLHDDPCGMSLFRGSQDAAGVDSRARRVSVEIKCPYGDREPRCYRGVKDYYVAQMQLHMRVEDSEMCYFVCWTPERTRIWIVMRSREFWERLSAYVGELVAMSDRSCDAAWVLAESALLRAWSAEIARQSGEIKGSPFVSAWAQRHDGGDDGMR